MENCTMEISKSDVKFEKIAELLSPQKLNNFLWFGKLNTFIALNRYDCFEFWKYENKKFESIKSPTKIRCFYCSKVTKINDYQFISSCNKIVNVREKKIAKTLKNCGGCTEDYCKTVTKYVLMRESIYCRQRSKARTGLLPSIFVEIVDIKSDNILKSILLDKHMTDLSNTYEVDVYNPYISLKDRNMVLTNYYQKNEVDFLLLYDTNKEKLVSRFVESEKGTELYSLTSYINRDNEEIFVVGGKGNMFFFRISDSSYFKKLEMTILDFDYVGWLFNLNDKYILAVDTHDSVFLVNLFDFSFIQHKCGKKGVGSYEMMVKNDNGVVFSFLDESASICVFSLKGINLIDEKSEMAQSDLEERVNFLRESLSLYSPLCEVQVLNVSLKNKRINGILKVSML